MVRNKGLNQSQKKLTVPNQMPRNGFDTQFPSKTRQTYSFDKRQTHNQRITEYRGCVSDDGYCNGTQN